jgi:hypothetical protein
MTPDLASTIPSPTDHDLGEEAALIAPCCGASRTPQFCVTQQGGEDVGKGSDDVRANRARKSTSDGAR